MWLLNSIKFYVTTENFQSVIFLLTFIAPSSAWWISIQQQRTHAHKKLFPIVTVWGFLFACEYFVVASVNVFASSLLSVVQIIF